MTHFSVSRKGDLTTAAKRIFSGYWIANSSRQGVIISRSQHIDQLRLTQTPSEDSCEQLQESFVTFPAEDAHLEVTKNCKSTLQRQTRIDFKMGAKKKNWLQLQI